MASCTKTVALQRCDATASRLTLHAHKAHKVLPPRIASAPGARGTDVLARGMCENRGDMKQTHAPPPCQCAKTEVTLECSTVSPPENVMRCSRICAQQAAEQEPSFAPHPAP
jgi:hypothetical protein